MKILVVEDEFYARKRIVKILEESSLNIEIIADVENGAQAKQFIDENNDIDIVITDICMAEMDGIELAKYIYYGGKDIQVIITTAYGEFEYAKKAIEFQVKKFITKPIKKDELIDDIMELMEQKEREQTRIRKFSTDLAKKFSQRFISFKNIVENPELSAYFLPYTVKKNSNLFFRVGVLQFEDDAKEGDIEFISSVIPHIFGLQKYDFIYLKENDEFIFVYYFSKDGSSDERIRKGCNDLLDYISKKSDYMVTMGIGGIYSETEDLYSSYKEGVYAINQRLIHGWNRLYIYSPIYSQRKNKRDSPDETIILAIIENANHVEAKRYIHDILIEFSSKDSNILDLYEVVLNILKAFNKYVRRVSNGAFHSKEEMEIMFTKVSLYNYKNIQDIESYLLLFLSNIYQEKDDTHSTVNPIINSITEYVENNYQYNISLQDLAEKKFYVNYSYLSRAFKREVGKSFSKYLTGVRIEKSKELLLSSTMKINDIATCVGYNSVSHYIQSFKKVVGITPNDYRNEELIYK